MKSIGLLALTLLLGCVDVPQKSTNRWPQQTSKPVDSDLACEMEAHQKIRCCPAGISSCECKAINCCYDANMCYYGRQGGRPFKVSNQPHAESPVPPPPKAKSSAAEAPRQQNDDILNLIFPPREWMEGNQLWVQQVSSAPCTRADVVNLEEHLDRKLQQRRAIETGICPVRRELYTQCFDELIRQVTINCAERGHLLLRVRDEIQMTIAAYQTFYESSVVFGMRKALQAEQDKVDMEKKIAVLEQQKEELQKELRDEKAKCDAIEKTEEEKHEVQEKKYTEQIQFLKRTNQQLKAQLEGVVTPK